eukprot:471109-Hanusia_phi.AAC.1
MYKLKRPKELISCPPLAHVESCAGAAVEDAAAGGRAWDQRGLHVQSSSPDPLHALSEGPQQHEGEHGQIPLFAPWRRGV